MIRDNLLPAAELYSLESDQVIPLTTGRDLRLALKRYRIPASVMAMIANLSDWELEHALGQRRLSGTMLVWYQCMRRYEHSLTETIQADMRQYGESVLPRFLSDRHMAMYSPEAWAILPSARIASGIRCWVSEHIEGADNCRVKIYDFNKLSYDRWLDEHSLRHDSDVLDFWCAKQYS